MSVSLVGVVCPTQTFRILFRMRMEYLVYCHHSHMSLNLDESHIHASQYYAEYISFGV